MWDDLIAALNHTGIPFAHFAWAKDAKATASEYGVYAEDNELSLYANNAHAEKVLEGTIDVFTHDGTGAAKRNVESALTLYNVPYHLNSIQFEEDTGYLHYEWVFQVLEPQAVIAPLEDPDRVQFEDEGEDLLYCYG